MGFALVDSIRGCERPHHAPGHADDRGGDDDGARADHDGRERPARRRRTPPPTGPTGELDGVLTFVDADDCRVRTIGLSSGRERPPSRFVTDCRGFWAPKVGSRIAFGEVLSEGFFRIADLGHPRRDFGSYPIGASTAPLWSADGQQIAWCESPNTGIERDILGQGRLLDFCPIAYTPDGELAHAEGPNLVLDGRTLLTASGPIDWAQFGPGGTVLVSQARRSSDSSAPAARRRAR